MNPAGLSAVGVVVTGSPAAMDAVWMLERSGASPPDTTVTFRASAGRTIVMRHGPPDNAIFAMLEIPPGAVVPKSGSQSTIRLAPSAGRYGVLLETSDSLGTGIRLTYSFAMHFQEPGDAIATYPTPGRFEQATAAAHILGNGQLQFVASERPAADMIRFPITAAGTWLLAARK